MGQYTIVLEALAEKELRRHFKTGDKGTIKRINQIFEELKFHPETGIGQPEALKYGLSGIWSKKLSQKDRLIYRVEENIVTVFIISALGHYNDK